MSLTKDECLSEYKDMYRLWKLSRYVRIKYNIKTKDIIKRMRELLWIPEGEYSYWYRRNCMGSIIRHERKYYKTDVQRNEVKYQKNKLPDFLTEWINGKQWYEIAAFLNHERIVLDDSYISKRHGDDTHPLYDMTMNELNDNQQKEVTEAMKSIWQRMGDWFEKTFAKIKGPSKKELKF